MPHDAMTSPAYMAIEPTLSAREAATLLRRSRSWIDQRLRNGQFTHADGAVIQPLRTRGHYRRFNEPMLVEIAFCCYRRGWLTESALQAVLREIARAVLQSG